MTACVGSPGGGGHITPCQLVPSCSVAPKKRGGAILKVAAAKGGLTFHPRIDEEHVAVKDRAFEPGIACEGRAVEPRVAREGCVVEPDDV